MPLRPRARSDCVSLWARAIILFWTANVAAGGAGAPELVHRLHVLKGCGFKPERICDVGANGGTFSAITGLLRPPSAGTTFFLRDNHGYFGYAKNLAPAWWIGFDRDGHIEAPFAITVRGKQIAFSEDHPDRTGTTGDA